jgi:hypothetical protein
MGFSYGTGRDNSKDEETHKRGISLKAFILLTVAVMIIMAVLMLLSDGSSQDPQPSPPAPMPTRVIMAQEQPGAPLPTSGPLVRHPVVTN